MNKRKNITESLDREIGFDVSINRMQVDRLEE